jgi:rare lipoprotein A
VSNKQSIIFILVFGGLLLSGCGSPPIRQDSAPAHHVDHTRVPDAVPRLEPRSKYGNPKHYEVQGKRYYVLNSAQGFHQRGVASWYGTKFHGRRTSSGEPYDMYAMTAAHKTLPIPVYVEVTNLDNHRKIIVRVNDRGPFAHNRIIDLSYVAAKKLGIAKHGTGRVEIRTIDLSEKTSSPTTAVAKTPPGRLYLQVGAFTDRNNATQLLSRLTTATAENILINHKTAGDKNIYRVRIGPLGSEADARQLRSRLAPLGIDASHIVVE